MMIYAARVWILLSDLKPSTPIMNRKKSAWGCARHCRWTNRYKLAIVQTLAMTLWCAVGPGGIIFLSLGLIGFGAVHFLKDLYLNYVLAFTLLMTSVVAHSSLLPTNSHLLVAVSADFV